MATLAAIMDGLETRLATVSGLRTYEYPPDNLSPPAAFVNLPTAINFDLAGARAADNYEFIVRVLVAKVSDRAARTKLAGYLNPTGSTSIKSVIEADNILGGAADSVWVRSAENVGIFTVGGVEYLGCDFIVEVIA
jgi:hypothetical protein